MQFCAATLMGKKEKTCNKISRGSSSKMRGSSDTDDTDDNASESLLALLAIGKYNLSGEKFGEEEKVVIRNIGSQVSTSDQPRT